MASRCGESVAWSAPGRRIREVFPTSETRLHREVEVAMNGFRRSRVIVIVALMAALSAGCAGSRSRCHAVGCKVSSSAGSVPPRRTQTAATSHGTGQRNCPVTGEPLGSMGDPVSVTVQGRTIEVCCQGCVAAVQKNPEKYLKIVDDELARSDSSKVRRAAFYDQSATTVGGARSSDGCRSCPSCR